MIVGEHAERGSQCPAGADVYKRHAQYRAQEQGRKPEERPPAARERTLIRPDAKPEAAPVAEMCIRDRSMRQASVPCVSFRPYFRE